MRSICFIALTLLGVQSIAQFTARQSIIRSMGYGDALDTADLDNDGDADILYGSSYSGYILNAHGIFSAPIVLDSIHPVVAIHPIPMDDDDLLDILTVHHDGTLSWYRNLGSGQFSSSIAISTYADILVDGLISDMDMDGDQDLVLITATTLEWLPNLGNGIWGAPMPIWEIAEHADVALGDLDNDGDADILWTGENGILWLRNDPGGTFSASTTLSNNFQGRRVHAADLDLDGDKDVIAVNSESSGKAIWFLNNGNGDFGPEHVKMIYFTCYDINAADIDLDGNLDLVAGTSSGPRAYLGDGIGAFSISLSWIDKHKRLAGSILLLDLNDDGTIDILSAGNTLQWHANLGNMVFQPNPALLAPAGGSFVQAADMDGNETLDAIYHDPSSDEIRWCANLGNGLWGASRFITSGTGTAIAIYVHDLNSDGFPDLIIPHHKIYDDDDLFIYTNPGNDTIWTRTILSEIPNKMGEDLHFADVNGDGAVDILGSFVYDGYLVWMENVDMTFISHTIYHSNNFAPRQCALLDIDDDDDLDIVYQGYLQSTLHLITNNGAGGFTPPQILDEGPISLSEMEPGDFDGDGHMDLAARRSPLGPNLFWYHNNGVGWLDSRETLDSLSSNASVPLATADMDGDGDDDIIVATALPGQVFWYESQESGFVKHFISPEAYGEGARIALADLDGDLDMDILSSSSPFFPRNISWYRNDAPHPYTASGRCYWDKNGDGQSSSGEPAISMGVSINPISTFALANPSGGFTFSAPPGAYEISSVATSAYWQLSSNSSYSIELGPSNPSATDLDFGYIPLHDTSLVMGSIAATDAVCDSPWKSFATITNEGIRSEHGIISMTIPTGTSFISATPIADSIISNVVHWHFDSLQCFAELQYVVTATMPGAWFSGDTMLTLLDVLHSPYGGGTAHHSYTEWSDVLTCAFDPNDKRVSPTGIGNQGAIDLTTKTLRYTVRFQNTGTDTAHSVVIQDPLDSALDPWTLDVLVASHSLTSSSIDPTGLLTFRFDDIVLPDSSIDLLGSQGFVQFEVDLKPGLPVLTRIANEAQINFGLNAPISTNKTLNTLVDCNLIAPIASTSLIAPSILIAPPGYHYQWYMNEDALQNENNQALSVDANGYYSVLVTDDWGCTALSAGYPFFTTNINKPEISSMTVQPNPLNHTARVLFSQSFEAQQTLELVDLHAHSVRSWRGDGSRELGIDRNGLAAGIYLLRLLENGISKSTVSVVIQ